MPREKQLKILLVEADPAMQNEFDARARECETFSLAKIATGEKEALELMASIHPHVVITELRLLQGDGLSLIKAIRDMQGDLTVSPYIVVTTHTSSAMTLSVLNLFADYHFSKDTVDFGADLVFKNLDIVKVAFNTIGGKEFAPNNAPADYESRLRGEILNRIVNRLNLSPKAKGRTYIIEGLIIAVGLDHKEMDILQHTKDIYPALARRYKRTAQSINTAIENVIAYAWKTTDPETLRHVYRAYINPDRGIPTPGEFLKYYAEVLKADGW